MRGNDDSISLGHATHGTSDFLDDTERLVADDSAFDAAHPTLIEMQVCAADRAGGDAQKDVGRFTHLRIANFSYCDAPCFFEDDCFHRLLVGFVGWATGADRRVSTRVIAA